MWQGKRWLIHCFGFNPCDCEVTEATYSQGTEESARSFASEMAERHPGKTFFIYEVRGAACCDVSPVRFLDPKS
jgi:hypothetical protein